MSYKTDVQNLLIELDFKKVIWCGSLHFLGSRKRIRWEADFVSWEGIFEGPSAYKEGDHKDKMKEVLKLLVKMHAKRGFEIEVPPEKRIPKYGDLTCHIPLIPKKESINE